MGWCVIVIIAREVVVRVGRRAEVLATGMRRLRDAQCRAEAYAATLPEVAAALAQAEAGLER